MNIALILAGGSGTRSGLEYPKQFYKVHDKPVIVYTLEKFQNSPSVDAICVVCGKKWAEEVLSYRKVFGISKLAYIAEGGSTGLKSALNGLIAITDASTEDLILIHDAVRPFVDVKVIEENIRVAQKYGLAMTSVNCVETLVYAADDCYAEKMIPRKGLKRILTPQTFRYGDILHLLQTTDLDACREPSAFALWMSAGHPIYCSPGNEKNIKLTYPEDIEYFTQLFS